MNSRMKLIIMNGGIAECTLNAQIGLFRMLDILKDLYMLIPDACIYVDVGNGAHYIDPHCPHDTLNTIPLHPFIASEDNHA